MRDSDEKTNVRHFRTANRYFCQDGQWWFSTREGEEGPFPTREQAELARERFVNAITAMQKYKEEHDALYKNKKEDEKPVDRSIWNNQFDVL